MRASSRSFLLAALFATAVAVPALAQSSGPLTTYAVCATTPSKQDSEAAHSAFLLGKRFFDEADYGSAIHNFVDAYKLDCTKTELLTIIARANELSGNRAEAVHALETYLTRAQTIPAEDRAQIQKRIDNLKAQMTPASASATVVAPPASATASTAPTTSTASTTTVLVPAPATPSQGHTAGPWIVAGTGLAVLAGGVIVFAIGAGKVSSSNTACPGHVCPKGDLNAQTDISNGNDGRSLESVGGILMGVGGAALAGGLLWHFLEPSGPAQPSDTKAHLTPTVGPGYAGASLGGRF